MDIKPKHLLLVLGSFMIFSSCIKNNPLKADKRKCDIPDQLCDSALLIVGNKTADSIFFDQGQGLGGVEYYMSVAPGGIAIIKTGGVDVRFNSDCSVYHFMGSIEQLRIPGRYFSVTMNRCAKRVSFIESASIGIDLEDLEQDK